MVVLKASEVAAAILFQTLKIAPMILIEPLEVAAAAFVQTLQVAPMILIEPPEVAAAALVQTLQVGVMGLFKPLKGATMALIKAQQDHLDVRQCFSGIGHNLLQTGYPRFHVARITRSASFCKRFPHPRTSCSGAPKP